MSKIFLLNLPENNKKLVRQLWLGWTRIWRNLWCQEWYFCPTSTSSNFCGKFRLVNTEMTMYATYCWWSRSCTTWDLHKNLVDNGKQIINLNWFFTMKRTIYMPHNLPLLVFISPERSRGLPWFLATQMMKTTASKLFARCGACWPKLEVSLKDHNNLHQMLSSKNRWGDFFLLATQQRSTKKSSHFFRKNIQVFSEYWCEFFRRISERWELILKHLSWLLQGFFPSILVCF